MGDPPGQRFDRRPVSPPAGPRSLGRAYRFVGEENTIAVRTPLTCLNGGHRGTRLATVRAGRHIT